MSNELLNTITKEEYARYEAVRKSGVTNMFHWKNVNLCSGLSKDKIIAIMQNYEALMVKYPDVRKGS